MVVNEILRDTDGKRRNRKRELTLLSYFIIFPLRVAVNVIYIFYKVNYVQDRL